MENVQINSLDLLFNLTTNQNVKTNLVVTQSHAGTKFISQCGALTSFPCLVITVGQPTNK